MITSRPKPRRRQVWVYFNFLPILALGREKFICVSSACLAASITFFMATHVRTYLTIGYL